MHRVMLVSLLVAGVACGGAVEEPSPIPIPVALLDPSALRPVEPDRDPFAAHRPVDPACPAATWGPEGGGFEVQTGACAYASFDQPLPFALDADDVLTITVWHDFLDAAEPARGHVAVWLETDVLWETHVDIPAPSRTFEVTVPIPRTPARDARLGLHVHNHGFNSWRFVAIDRKSDP